MNSLAYRVGTYADFRATMQMDLSSAALPALAGLRTRELDDPSMALLDAWAVGADVLSFYQERIANEGYLRTATERRSVLELGKLLDYRLRPGVAASVYLAYTIDPNSGPVTIPAGSRAQSVPAPGQQMQTFETSDDLDAQSEWNALQPRLTQPQNISLDTIAGLGEVWVASISTNLKQNDRLLFQFGNLQTGVSAIRLVQSVDVQQTDQRSHVVLHAFDPAIVQSVAAANTAIAALAVSGGLVLTALEVVRQNLLLGKRYSNASDVLSDFIESGGGRAAPPAPVAAFTQAVQQAFTAEGVVTSPAAGGFTALFGALTLPLSLQPANSLRLQRSVSTALGIASDTRPQLLLNFATPLIDTFYRAWTNVPHGDPSPTLSGVFAMRVTASLFGYNAPSPMTIVQTWNSANDQSVSTPTPGTLTLDEIANRLSLDNVYDGVAAGSYVVIQPPDNQAQMATPVVVQVASARTVPRTDYGISGKTTQLTLVDTSGEGTGGWTVPDVNALRGTQVYAQSEALPLAERVLADDVGEVASSSAGIAGDGANRLTLDTAVDGLKAGRWVIVQGQRTDVPGTEAVTAAEPVMLLAVEQGVAADLPGDTIHSTLVFANSGLAYTYLRSSVTIYANVVDATHGQTRDEVLGNGSGATAMQTFQLKQSPLTYVSAATVDGVQSTLSASVNGVLWHEARNLAFVGARDRNFVTAIDNAGNTNVTFGDGIHGARLPTGVENITAVYRNGIGTPGNVDAQQISLLATKPLGVTQVINPLGASGGADPETRDQARRNVPLAVLALDRLVSVADYADFARTFGGVGKASSVKLGNQVRVTIAGADDAPIDTTSDLYRNLLQAMQKYGDLSLSLGLDVRELLVLTLSAKVGLAPDYVWENVEPLVRAALLNAFGFESRDLAQNIYLSEVVACIQAVAGVAWVDVDAFGSFDEATLLADFSGDSGDGDGDGSGNGSGSPGSIATAPAMTASASAQPPQRVVALPARYEDGTVQAAQLLYLLADVPDTLLLQEATS
ncbi:putative baseplate assembly protein [Rhodanobacter sp. MP7CTX1]|uniref:putative baseplate assembly protein n=1 Tax=Rhodanobacter sp. MP7CTX1 TaxID=2723084 RepID=UPI0017CBF4B1|nr:putative baseplate assembly protein [Rhodanobacter sp. MP7CTX1]MBB6187835.1 putative phage baseplate assembly protein [Rhodanobacter sp. MP7CTX1]